MPDEIYIHFFIILGEGMTSALVWTDFYKLAKEVGFTQPCLVSVSPLPICDKKYREALGEFFIIIVLGTKVVNLH